MRRTSAYLIQTLAGIVVAVLVLAGVAPASTAPPSPVYEWHTFYNYPGQGWNYVNDLGSAVDTAGNVYIEATCGGQLGIWKYDATGQPAWNTIVSAPQPLYGGGIVLDKSGNIYIAGSNIAAPYGCMLPPALAKLTLSPASVVGEVSTTGNYVTLNAPAPAGGVLVTLQSDTPSVASPPPSVTVAAGQTTSPTFTITTFVVAAQTTVHITATYGSVNKTGTLVVKPLGPSVLTLNPNTVKGGTPTTKNRVTLNAPAPAGGALVVLSSSNPGVANPPASVTVVAGATSSPLFKITTSAVTSSTQVTISATYNGVVKTAILTVN